MHDETCSYPSEGACIVEEHAFGGLTHVKRLHVWCITFALRKQVLVGRRWRTLKCSAGRCWHHMKRQRNFGKVSDTQLSIERFQGFHCSEGLLTELEYAVIRQPLPQMQQFTAIECHASQLTGCMWGLRYQHLAHREALGQAEGERRRRRCQCAS